MKIYKNLKKCPHCMQMTKWELENNFVCSSCKTVFMGNGQIIKSTYRRFDLLAFIFALIFLAIVLITELWEVNISPIAVAASIWLSTFFILTESIVNKRVYNLIPAYSVLYLKLLPKNKILIYLNLTVQVLLFILANFALYRIISIN